MTTQHTKGEFDHLKEELKRLKRAGAPWYFESELHRRLHGGHAHRQRLAAFPLNKAYVITFVALASLAAAGYMMMMHAGLFSPRPAIETGNVVAAPPDTLRAPSPGPAVARSAASSGKTLSDTKTSILPGSEVSGVPADAPRLTIPAVTDSAGRSDLVKGSQAVKGEDSAKGGALLPPVQSRTDSVKSGAPSQKDTITSRHDSVTSLKDTLRPGVPVK
jgi:hypothetical protein